jgi:hypothetical protein
VRPEATPAGMSISRREVHTTVCCAHPYFGFVCTPNAIIDFSDRVPAEFNHGASATIDANGFRNDGVPAVKPHGEFWIGVFGGSVAFGVPATDNSKTIAGCLERRLNASPRPGGKRVRAINLAIPGGQQPQQLLVLTLNRHLLDGVITFDGVNEVVVPSCYNKDHVPADFPYRPYYEALFGQTINETQAGESMMVERATERFRRRPGWQQRLLAPFFEREMKDHRHRLAAAASPSDEFHSIYGDTGGAPAAALAVDGARRWAADTTLMREVCRAQGIESLFVVQPIPDRAKPLTASERAHLDAQPDIVAIRAAGYARVLEHAAELSAGGCPAVSFETVFSGCAESIYTDVVHFEDRGSAIVADRLAEQIAGSWTGFSG